MNERTRSGRAAVAALPLLLALASSSPAADLRGRDVARLLDRVAPSVVSVKIVLKTEFAMGESSQDQESTLDARGVIVGERGLVMLWNSQLSASRLMEAVARMDPTGGGGFKLKMTPTDFRVTIPGDATEHPAFLAASDSDLDLAFLQLEQSPTAKLPAISFAGGRSVAVGDELLGVTRLSPGFDRSPYVAAARVRGRLEKPRRAWIVDVSPDLLGLPLFTESGEAAGAVVTIFSRATDATASGGDVMSLFAMNGARMETGPLGVFLLPAERLAGLVELARKRADELLEERRAAEVPPATPTEPAAASN